MKSWRTPIVACIAGLSLVLGACATENGGARSVPAAGATVTVTATPTGTTPTQSTTPTNLSSSAGSASRIDPNTDAPSSAATAMPSLSSEGVTGTPGDMSRLPEPVAGEPLTLGDFFEPNRRWTENSFSVADMSDVKGMANDTLSCGEQYEESGLELRLQNKFDTLAFSVAESNGSKKSDQQLVVRVMADNDQLDVKRIAFNEVESFTVPVTDRNAVRIEVNLDDEVDDCSAGSAQAVIFDAEVK